MKQKQNAIGLVVTMGLRELGRLVETEDAVILPGTLGHIYRDGYRIYLSTHPKNVVDFDPGIILENTYEGTGLNARQFIPHDDFTYIMIRNLFDGDVYLIRAVVGSYYTGQPLFATQTENGVFVSPNGEGCFIGWCQEDYTVTEDMLHIVDDGKTYTNNIMVNLVKVRVGTRYAVLSENLV